MRPVRHDHVCAHFALVGGDAHDWVFARLVIATAVAVVLVVVVLRAFAVVVVAVAHVVLIPWICMALSVQMLGVRPALDRASWWNLREESCGRLHNSCLPSCIGRGRKDVC
jgi:hypothetical protein